MQKEQSHTFYFLDSRSLSCLLISLISHILNIKNFRGCWRKFKITNLNRIFGFWKFALFTSADGLTCGLQLLVFDIAIAVMLSWGFGEPGPPLWQKGSIPSLRSCSPCNIQQKVADSALRRLGKSFCPVIEPTV